MKKFISTYMKTIMLSFALLLVSKISNAQLSVVANESVAESDASLADVKSIFKAKKTRWKDGSKITLVMLKPESSGGSQMCSKVFGQSPADVNKFYMALVFQGQITAPKFCGSEEELKSYVKNTKGAVGILPAKDAGGIKKIKVDGSDAF